MKKYALFLSLLLIVFQFSCTKKNNQNIPVDDNNTEDPVVAGKAELVILYTNDEHGWLEGDDTFGGAAGIYKLWENREGYSNSADSFLVISGGDMWTGPAISTWYQGESMIDVMNTMEYDVATIGNHEFDYSIEGLNKNKALLEFPLIAANIHNKSNGEIPSFATPYVIENVDGIKVGVIGLASTGTPYLTFPAFVADYNFTSYEDAILEYAPIVKAQGADVVIVVGHIAENEMTQLAPVAASQGIKLITGGHSHAYVNKVVDGVNIIEAGSNMKSYGKIVIEYDKDAKTTNVLSAEIVDNPPLTVSNKIQDVVNTWKAKAEGDLEDVIGYCSETISVNSPAMQNMVADSWLYAYPQADISMTNSGGIRQNILPGDITVGTIVGLLPFTNILYVVQLTGTQVIDCIGNFVIGGMSTVGGYHLLKDGSAIEPDRVYSVITTDFLYSQTNSKFAQYDPNPFNTSITYAQPTIDWIRSKNSTAQDPINNYLDLVARR